MDPLEQLRHDILQRKLLQNARRAKAGKPPMWPELLKKPVQKTKRASRAVMPPAPESGREHDTAMSFEEWKGCGWSVKKGEKCDHIGVDGIPQFLRSQVRRDNPAWGKWRKRNT